MSIIGNAVTLGGGGEPELLWTNPNPTTAFNEGTTIPVGAGYDAYLVELRSSKGTYNTFWGITYLPADQTAHRLGIVKPSYDYDLYVRSATADGTLGTITFGNGVYKSNFQQLSDDYAIPNRIWGVKWAI